MGKSKKKKFKAPKPQPTGLPSVKNLEADIDESEANLAVKEPSGTVAEIIEKLQSPNTEDKEVACSTLANLVTQNGAIPILLQQNVIKILAPLIVDTNPHIRHVALGALRNFSVDGGHEVCEEMIHKDVLTPLVAFFQKCGVGWIPEKCEGKKHTDTTSQIFTEAVHLLWNLCEGSDLAVSVFNKENLMQYLFPCLQPDVYGYAVAVAVAQCLHTVTEDNKMAASFCRQTESQSLLQKAISPDECSESVLLSILATGILVNAYSGEMSSASGEVVNRIIATAVSILSINTQSLIESAVDSVNQNGNSMNGEDGVLEEERKSWPKGKLKDVHNILTAQQVSLEIMANLCCSEDDSWEDMDSCASSSSDDMPADIEMEESNDTSSFTPLCVPTEVHSAFEHHDLLSKVLSAAQPLNEKILELLECCPGGNKIIKSLSTVQVHALLCVNNIVNAMEAGVLGGLANLHKMWDGLVQLSLSKQATEKLDLLEAVTSAMRAVIQKLAELDSPKFSEVTRNDLNFLFNLSQHCEDKQVRVNAIRCMSTIGCLLTKNQQLHTLLKDMGVFLLDLIGHDSDLWIVAEALDATFDIFGEDHLDPIVVEIDLVDKLRKILPMLKSRINSQRENLGEHYPVISTAKTNLVRFIKYKSSQH
ncbi:HEAT repeat-containing protein 3-like [Gigantopelta aegis]|uniref:HEAT repeat-containing protein 3-like n=1 Tax=Gigantopelta aegis TaxID=1735272 RepID=UPI001B887C99|nr:HEAT repeat-containing protein 3-like [Gigantopelta aegis]